MRTTDKRLGKLLDPTSDIILEIQHRKKCRTNIKGIV